MGQDILEKRAQYIAKNNELAQEFHYAHRSTKVFANNIFNIHFYDAPLWDLFSPAFQKLDKTWNTSNKLLSLPLRAHRYLIEQHYHIQLGETRLVFDYGKKFRNNQTDGKPRRLCR